MLAFLLLQHKSELGVKEVRDVTIFREDIEKNPGVLVEVELLFTIVDVAEGEEDEEEGLGSAGLMIKGRGIGGKKLMYVKKERDGSTVHEFRLGV
jgi:hypothetical protein